MRIAVMGAGGVGGTLGGLLAQAGHEVSIIARGAHLDAIRRNGLSLNGACGDLNVTVAATDDPSEIGPVDLVLFTVKTYHNAQAIPAIRPLVGPSTAVLTLQNGVESAQQITSVVGEGHVLPGAYWTPGHIESPGFISVVSQPSLNFGEVSERAGLPVSEILSALGEAGVKASVAVDPTLMLWDKFVPFCALAGVTSASRTRIKRLILFPEGRELFHSAIREGEAVARAKGVALEANLIERSESFFDNLPWDYQTSLHKDFDNGRPTEIDALNGAIVRLGREVGVPTPVHSFLYAVLRPLKDGAAEG